jgi:nitrite reductase/ring-hydroxylating ferredoxin subunit
LSHFSKTFFFKIMGLLLLILLGCGKDKIERNPYLASIRFNVNLNLNLPGYDNLRYAGGGQSIRQGGINGLLVFNLNGNDFLAWESTCPNHLIRDCSDLYITGVLAECACEGFEYSLATGQLLNPKEDTKKPYPMLFYNVRRSGNTLQISN